MSKTQRTFTVALWCLVVVGLLALLAMTRWEARERDKQTAVAATESTLAGRSFEVDAGGNEIPVQKKAVDYTFDAPAFALTDQQDKPFDSSMLRGKVWTAMFFFSECTGVCPAMTERIESLQKVTPDPRVQCVSFSVDPERDTPAKLAKYAEKTKADPSRWHLLTGAEADLKRVALGFRLPFDKPSDHSSKIMLVDQKGVVRSYYDSQDTDEMFRLQKDIQRLLDEPSQVATQTERP